jgi:hypothetical protein
MDSSRLIPTSEIREDDIPTLDLDLLDVDAPQWAAVDRFALSFDGYAFTGLGVEFQLLDIGIRQHFADTGELPIRDLTWLRLFLFIDQRRAHAGYSGAPNYDSARARYWKALLDEIRRAVRDAPALIPTAQLRREQIPSIPETDEPILGPRVALKEVWRFARSFDARAYFAITDFHGRLASFAQSVRVDFQLHGKLPRLGELGMLRACLAYEAECWHRWDDEAWEMPLADYRYLCALLDELRSRLG